LGGVGSFLADLEIETNEKNVGCAKKICFQRKYLENVSTFVTAEFGLVFKRD
jgi:hypothetical protein